MVARKRRLPPTQNPTQRSHAGTCGAPYPDSCEDHDDDYVLTPRHGDEAQVPTALIHRAQQEHDVALAALLAETATFEHVPHTMVDGQLDVRAETTNAVYR